MDDDAEVFEGDGRVWLVFVDMDGEIVGIYNNREAAEHHKVKLVLSGRTNVLVQAWPVWTEY